MIAKTYISRVSNCRVGPPPITSFHYNAVVIVVFDKYSVSKSSDTSSRCKQYSIACKAPNVDVRKLHAAVQGVLGCTIAFDTVAIANERDSRSGRSRCIGGTLQVDVRFINHGNHEITSLVIICLIIHNVAALERSSGGKFKANCS